MRIPTLVFLRSILGFDKVVLLLPWPTMAAEILFCACKGAASRLIVLICLIWLNMTFDFEGSCTEPMHLAIFCKPWYELKCLILVSTLYKEPFLRAFKCRGDSILGAT